MSRLYRPWKTVTPTISVRFSSSGRNTSAISSSFQTQSAFTTTSVTSAGADSGRTILQRIRRCEAPSMAADSNSSRGIARKKFVSR